MVDVKNVSIKNFALEKLGQEMPEVKLVDHALAGAINDSLATHGLKQEAHTRMSLDI